MPKRLEIEMRLNRAQAQEAIEKHIADVKRAEAAQKAAAASGVDATKKAAEDKLAASAKAITAEEALRIAADRRIIASNEAKVGIAIKALSAEERAQLSLIDKAKGHALSIKDAALSYATFGNAVQILATINAMWVTQRKDIEESVLRVTKYQEKLLELAGLKDKLGNPGAILPGQLEFRAKTGQTAEQAIAFQAGALNTGQSSTTAGYIKGGETINGKYVPGEFDKLLEKIGEYQAATNADPKAIGELAGLLPAAIGKQGQSADEVNRRAVGIFKTLQLGGSDLGPAVNQYKQNVGLIGPGLFTSPEQLAAIQSTFSVENALEAGTRTKQFLQATSAGLVKSGSTGKENTMPQSAYLKSLGMTDQNNPEQIGLAIAADLKAKNATLTGDLTNPDGSLKPLMNADKTLNPLTYLASKGYEDQDTRNVLIAFAKNVNTGQYGKTFAGRTTAESAPTAAEAEAELEPWRVSQVRQSRDTDLSGDLADVSKASKAEAFYLDAKKRAYNELRADPNSGVSGGFDTYNNSPIWEGRLLDKMREDIEARAKAVGVEMPKSDPMFRGIESLLNNTDFGVGHGFGVGVDEGVLGGGAFSRLIRSGRSRAMEYYNLDQQIKAAGGAPADNRELLGALKSIDQGIGKLVQKATQPPPSQVTPTVPSTVRPGPPVVQTR